MDEVTEEWLEKLYEQDDEGEWVNRMQLTRDDIAWDCLSEPQTAAIMLILVQGKTFDQAAEIKGITQRAIIKSFESGMARLKEYGLARRALKVDRSCIYAVEYYVNGLNQAEIAEKLGISQKTISVKLQEFKEKYEIM